MHSGQDPHADARTQPVFGQDPVSDVDVALDKLRQGVSHNRYTPLPVSAPQLAREWYRAQCDRAEAVGKRAPTWVALRPADRMRFIDDAEQWLVAYNTCAERNRERAGASLTGV